MEKGLHLSIIDGIYQWAAEIPNGVAVRCGGLTIPYCQLAADADGLAMRIGAIGDSCPFIGLSATKTAHTIVSMIGIIQSGKAYLPLDRAYPAERIAQMVEDAGIKHIVCDHTERAFFAQFGLMTLSISNDFPEEPVDGNPMLPGAGELVALLYTSGSTGIPKGVCLTQAGVSNLVNHEINARAVGPGTHNLLFSHLSFDVSLQEILVSLGSGGTLHVIDDRIRLDGAQLLHYVDEHQLHRLFLPYVALQYFTETAGALGKYPASLREVITGGELLKISPAIRNFFTQQSDCKLINIYGPTETSIWVTALELPRDANTWPDIPSIGRPISHVDIFLLDEELKKVPGGEIGELFVGGVAVSNGYLNREELTQQRYVQWVDDHGTCHRLYRTGDLGRYLPNGEIEFHGRADNQVKIRGNRVELGEIEVCLSELSEVTQSVVVLREDHPGIKRLVAYLVTGTGQQLHQAQLRNHLASTLPDYMIPAAFVWLDSFPQTPSGKIDRRALPPLAVSRPEISTLYRKPAAGNEQRISELWAELLQLDQVGADDNFFELGGNSLLAQHTIAQLRRRYELEIPITKLYQFPTAAQLATAIQQGSRPKQLQQVSLERDATPKRNKRVAIIGMAGRFPGAKNVEELWDVLTSAKETVTFFQDHELDPTIPEAIRRSPEYVKARGIIDQAEWFDAAVFGITPVMARLMDPQQRIFLEICRDVLEQTGYLAKKHQYTIGVYAGSGNGTYFMNNVQHHPDEIAKIGEFQTMLANEKDYLPTRAAYQLDLKGPAVAINTACSTSLVAVAQAVDAIRGGQSDIAIAGGVSITVPINSGHRYEDGAMFSTDGHTRPFDAEATGTVFSDGAGVVLLKDLEAAEADGDAIYAVIRGVGLSNDGGGKGSFMAPSAAGQAEAIQLAMADADFPPETIGYIETHGTATPLGDPIEIEGLKLAFGEVTTTQYCRIGSIKSNMGHLTHAAGVAGLIKAALSLHHRVIPPSINFGRPNPNIDFSETPFVVNESPFTWGKGERFRMGVSSFGVGGTNAHVALETYVSSTEHEVNANTIERPVLINWSAKTEESGRAYADQLAHFLQQHPTVSLDHLSYTLQTTREPLSNRYAVVASNSTQLVEKLAAKQWFVHDLREKTSHLAFLFPGQGAQYLNMGQTLYQNEPVYRTAVDQCANILLAEMGEDIRTVIFTDEVETGNDHLRNTYYTQPALFITSYALAKLWMNWGIKPTAYVGHSVGEFVAAHLAGVLSLEDALRLVAIRGRLCSTIPAGSMLSVRAAAEQITPLLSERLSIAAINAPNLCVVAGPQAEIEGFIGLLEAQELPCKPLHTSHAFHSSMMHPILDAFRTEVGRITLHVPQTPIVSTVTGTWLKDEQAISPEYWANHIIATVRFSDAITFLEREMAPIYLEAGPGQVTATLAKQHGAAFTKKTFSSLYTSEEDEYATLYQALGNLWLQGIEPQWENVYHEGRPRLIHGLPTYAYDRKPYWIGPKDFVTTLEKDHKHTVHPAMRKDLLINKVKDLLEAASGIDITDAPIQASFIEIGFDSLLLTQIAQSLKKAFGLPITFRMLNEEYPNLDLLGSYLDEQLPQDAFQPPVATPTPLQEAPPTATYPTVSQHIPQSASGFATQHLDAISLISQQISLISQQITMLQGATPVSLQQPQPLHPNSQPIHPNGQAALSDIPRPQAIKAEAPLAPDEATELKKPFGATARIEKQTAVLDESQTQYLADFVNRYVAKTAKSKAYTQQHRANMADPRVVSGFKPTTKEMTYSIVTNRSKGCRLWDIDGNEYIDALNGFGSNMLGYQPDVIAEALHQQIDEGYEIGPQHEKAGEVCQLICELTRMDRAALCNTGSEAVLGAMRIARTVTGRSTIVAFSNSYHGIVDEVIVRGTKKLKTFPAASGIMPEAVQNMLILDYGTPESLQIIRERASELAAVLVEPVQSRRPEFQPVEFVKELRQITTESGAALIFDEVITGFRMHLHGMQHVWGIEADLATYGKVVGSGLSVGVIAGKRVFMDALDGGYWEYGDASVPEVGVTYFAGTFVRHPLALAATKAALEYLKAQGPQLQENLTKRTKALADELNKVCEKYQTPLYIAQFGSLWKVKYHEEYAYSELLFAAMRLRGIHILDGFPCFLTTAHTEADIQQLVHAFEGSIHELVKAGFIPTIGELDLDNLPPIPNARRGRDKAGNLAWFVEDEQQPGKYLQIEQLN